MGYNVCDIFCVKPEPKSVQSCKIDFLKLRLSRIIKQLLLITPHLNIWRTTRNLKETLKCRPLVLCVILSNEYDLLAKFWTFHFCSIHRPKTCKNGNFCYLWKFEVLSMAKNSKMSFHQVFCIPDRYLCANFQVKLSRGEGGGAIWRISFEILVKTLYFWSIFCPDDRPSNVYEIWTVAS